MQFTLLQSVVTLRLAFRADIITARQANRRIEGILTRYGPGACGYEHRRSVIAGVVFSKPVNDR